MELQCFHVKSSFIISMFTYFMVHPCTEQGACSMEYISGTFLRVKGDQKAQVLYYAGLWIQFRIMTIILNIQSKTFSRINLSLTNWVGVVNPAFLIYQNWIDFLHTYDAKEGI